MCGVEAVAGQDQSAGEMVEFDEDVVNVVAAPGTAGVRDLAGNPVAEPFNDMVELPPS